MTGRDVGPCGCGMRRGFGRGYGGGFGVRYADPITLTKEEQRKVLEAELKEIETEKQAIEDRLKEMD
jgi:hypothetical protein